MKKKMMELMGGSEKTKYILKRVVTGLESKPPLEKQRAVLNMAVTALNRAMNRIVPGKLSEAGLRLNKGRDVKIRWSEYRFRIASYVPVWMTHCFSFSSPKSHLL